MENMHLSSNHMDLINWMRTFWFQMSDAAHQPGKRNHKMSMKEKYTFYLVTPGMASDNK